MPLAHRNRLLINFIAFQVGWFAAVLGGAWNWVGTGCIVAILIVAMHIATAAQPQRESMLVLAVVGLGAVWDSALASQRIIEYPHGVLVTGTAPIWILAVWALFATTLNLSLRYLKKRYWLAAVFGAIGAPLSFSAGMKLQALQFPDPTSALWTLAVGWAVLMPLLAWLAERFNGIEMEARK